MAAPAVTPLVSLDWLKANLGRPDIAVLDVRGEGAFTSAHIAGAVRTDFPGAWRTPDARVPPVPVLEGLIASLGIGNDKTVVIVPAGTDNTAFGAAARVYWTFKYLGHDSVAILDGGWSAWAADMGAPTASGTVTPALAHFTASPRPGLLATTQSVAARLHSATVFVDARPASQYLGTAGGGHIPGAINLENSRFYDDAAHRLKPKDELAALVPASLRADKQADVVAYCNTGWWSATDWFVLHELLGYQNAALYVQSMAGWSADPSNPIETGPASAKP